MHWTEPATADDSHAALEKTLWDASNQLWSNAALKPSEILPMVSASFSLAASAFVPVMVLGIFWRGTTRQGAVAGMLAGLGVAVYYMLSHVAAMRALPSWVLAEGLWFGIQPISAGVFGVPTGFCVAVLVSWWTRSPPAMSVVRSEL